MNVLCRLLCVISNKQSKNRVLKKLTWLSARLTANEIKLQFLLVNKLLRGFVLILKCFAGKL